MICLPFPRNHAAILALSLTVVLMGGPSLSKAAPTTTGPSVSSSGGTGSVIQQPVAKEIALTRNWQMMVRKQSDFDSHTLADLKQILADYANPNTPIVGNLNLNNGVTYLMPLAEALPRLNLTPNRTKT